MSEPAPNAPAPHKARRLWIPVTLLVTGVVLGLYHWLTRDEPPPDVRDLVLEARDIPPEENAYVVLLRAATNVDATPWSGAGKYELFFAMVRGESWDEEKAAAWLAANDKVWEDVERASQLPLSQGPVLKSLEEFSNPNVARLRDLMQVSQLRAWSLHRAGKTDEAFAWLATCLRAGQRIEGSRSYLLVWLLGLATHGSARETIDRIAAEGPVSAASAEELIRTLEETRPTGAAFAETVRGERTLLRLALEEIRQRRRNPGEADLVSSSTAESPFGFLIKPNRTEREHAEMLRRVIALVDADWPTLEAATPPDVELTRWQRWNPDNAGGRMLLSYSMPAFHTLLEKRLRAQSAISATQAFLAVRRHQLAHGTLPATLQDLVPASLPRIPIDYYDRAEIRYSRTARAIWSSGKDKLMITTPDQRVELGEVRLKLPPDPAPAPK